MYSLSLCPQVNTTSSYAGSIELNHEMVVVPPSADDMPEIEIVEPTVAELQAQLLDVRTRMTQYRTVLDDLITALMMVREGHMSLSDFHDELVDLLDNYA